MILRLCLFIGVCLCVDVQAKRATISQVYFDGARAVSDNVLQNGLLMRRGMPVDSALVVGDLKRILSQYRALGYWQARVYYPDIAVKNEQAILRFRIEEGGRTRVDSLIVSGQAVFAHTELMTAVAIKPGMVLTAEKVNEQLEQFLAFYENQGYPFCVLEPDVTFKDNSACVRVDVKPGPLCMIDTVVFEGNVVTRADVLIREMRLEAGKVYDQRRVDRALRYLRRLPFLISVGTPDVKRYGDETVLIVRVQEARTARVEGGVGYAPQGVGGGLTGAFALDIHNVAGAGRLGQVAWKRTGVGASDLRLRYQEPWVLDKPLSVDLEIVMGERLGYSEWLVGIGATARPWQEGQVWGLVSRGQVVPDSSGLGVYEKSDRWAIRVGLGVDYRDDLWNPRRGWFGDVAFELGRVEGVRQSDIRRLQLVNIQAFYPIGLRSVWALSGHGQWVSQDGGVPDDARIRVGGARSIRGYREEAFWATEVGWVSLEWRYLIGARSRLFVFGDAGALQDITGRVLPVGYGAGMVLQSRMGMIGFDVGWAKEDGFGDGKVHVRVVNAF
ncbi:MAG: BamA/TamA family outer membrane protein [Candidatus Latescibacteria bacterium]|nr:BamA/TamA family outer membrane protein [Candidatus Latescibacterota bacterium]